MKAGARCLGHRCDQIAKRDLLTAPDAPSKKKILDAQKACHIGSGTTEDQKDPDENAPPICKAVTFCDISRILFLYS